MPIVISDETLQQAGLSEQQARIEIACRLFDANKLSLWPAAQLAQLTRSQFESELHARHIAVYRPTVKDLEQDRQSMEKLG